MAQQGDVLLCQTIDGGEISVDSGIVEMAGGLPTAAYLSLFGGNADDDGSQDSSLGWWGNLLETETSRRYRSETQYLLDKLPATASNLRRLEDAARRDLAWMVTDGVASSVTATASIPDVNKVKMVIGVTAAGEESDFVFIENWKAKT